MWRWSYDSKWDNKTFSSFLHVCGGDPLPCDFTSLIFLFSPRMWRWSWLQYSQLHMSFVFSTYVEVIPMQKYNPKNYKKVFSTYVEVILVHEERLDGSKKFSPRMWRWSWIWDSTVRLFEVFSTYVEVILVSTSGTLASISFLHVCGGDPHLVLMPQDWSKFSPRMWRWSPGRYYLGNAKGVFSTYVEVILTTLKCYLKCLRFLHVCGGDPRLV